MKQLWIQAHSIKSTLKTHNYIPLLLHTHAHTRTGQAVPKATLQAPTSVFKSSFSLLLSFHKSSATNEIFCVTDLCCEEKAIKVKIYVWVQGLLVLSFRKKKKRNPEGITDLSEVFFTLASWHFKALSSERKCVLLLLESFDNRAITSSSSGDGQATQTPINLVIQTVINNIKGKGDMKSRSAYL